MSTYSGLLFPFCLVLFFLVILLCHSSSHALLILKVSKNCMNQTFIVHNSVNYIGIISLYQEHVYFVCLFFDNILLLFVNKVIGSVI